MQPSIQGFSSPLPAGSEYERYALGNAPTFTVDSSNTFYTTKVSGLVIASTTFTADDDPNEQFGSLAFTLSDSPDLSEVMIGNYFEVFECADIENTGVFEITAVNDGTDTITVAARNGVTNASSSGNAETHPFVGAYSLECLENTSGLSVDEGDASGATQPELTSGIGMLGDFSEVSISTSGSVRLKLK